MQIHTLQELPLFFGLLCFDSNVNWDWVGITAYFGIITPGLWWKPRNQCVLHVMQMETLQELLLVLKNFHLTRKFIAHRLRGQILSSYDSFVVADDDDYDGVDHHEVDRHDLHQVRSLWCEWGASRKTCPRSLSSSSLSIIIIICIIFNISTIIIIDHYHNQYCHHEWFWWRTCCRRSTTATWPSCRTSAQNRWRWSSLIILIIGGNFDDHCGDDFDNFHNWW